MPLYKVWNVGRNVRKIVKADTLTELLKKGQEKLAISAPVRLVLNSDGTDVDDDEILQYFGGAGETLLMLKSDEQWQSLTAAPTSSSVPPQENVTEPGPSAVSATEVRQKSYQPANTTIEASANDGKLGLTLPHPSRIELPEFNPNTTLLLQNNDDRALGGVLSEAAIFYHIKYPDMKDAAYYQAIGKRLVKKYPCLSYDGNKPWSYLTSKLSSRIRQIRTKENKKTATPTSDPNNQCGKQAKKFRLASTSTDVHCGKMLKEDDFNKRINEIEEEWDGNRTVPMLKLLMAETRVNRMDKIRKGTSVVEIMKAFPVLQDGSFVLDEFSALIHQSTEAIEEKVSNFFQKVAELLPNTAKGSGDSSTAIGLLEALERRVAITQGKGMKSKTVLTMLKMDSVDVPDNVMEKKLQVSTKNPLSLRVITDQDGEVKMCFIVGEGTYIDCKTENACKAVVQLLGTYYIFGLHYPAIYGQLLGFLQQHIVVEPYPFFKGTNFQTFSKKFTSCQVSQKQ